MHPSLQCLRKSLLIGLIGFSLTQCSDSTQTKAYPKVGQSNSGAVNKSNSGNNNSLAISDYPAAYCKYIGDLNLRSDISEHIDFICQNGAPSKQFIDFRNRALNQASDGIELVNLVSRHITEMDFSEFLIAWAFRVPIKPVEFKDRPIYQYLAQGYESEDIKLSVASSRLSNDSLDSRQHLWSVNLTYDLSVRGTESRFLESQRKTQYNLYQLVDGNEEMGLGVESLLDANNPDYDKSTMVNFSFHDEQGGTIVITILHFVMNNHGFPETATRSIQEIAQHTADVMYKGLTSP